METVACIQTLNVENPRDLHYNNFFSAATLSNIAIAGAYVIERAVADIRVEMQERPTCFPAIHWEIIITHFRVFTVYSISH